MDTQERNQIKVWDPVVRIGHWTLVICFFIAWFTEDDYLNAHVWAGYVLAIVVLFRVVWGFVGTKHARFSDFLYSPAKVIAYVGTLRKGPIQSYLGHNPAGGVMIILLLAFLSATVYTGLEVYAAEENAGPLAALNQTASVSVISSAQADSDRHELEHESREHDDEEEFWEELHELFANLTLLLIAVHVAGAVASSYLHQENLIKAMITGKKSV